MNKHTRAGFSLLEIVIAVAIVGLMMTIVVPGLLKYFTGSQKKAAETSLNTFKGVILTYFTHTGQYPERLQDLVQKPSDEAIARDWQGPYVEGKSALVDPWKRKYEYRLTPEGAHEYELYSYGPKGKGAPQTEWISVWDL